MSKRTAKRHLKVDPIARLAKRNVEDAMRKEIAAKKQRRHVLELIRVKDETWKKYKELYSLRSRTVGQEEEMAQLRVMLDKHIRELAKYGVKS